MNNRGGETPDDRLQAGIWDFGPTIIAAGAKLCDMVRFRLFWRVRMPMALSPLIVSGLPRAQASALRRKAERMSMSPEAYVRKLIAEDLKLDAIASSHSFADLAAPFKKSLAGLSESELDQMARSSRRTRKQ